jgi:hypothetical protein
MGITIVFRFKIAKFVDVKNSKYLWGQLIRRFGERGMLKLFFFLANPSRVPDGSER